MDIPVNRWLNRFVPAFSTLAAAGFAAILGAGPVAGCGDDAGSVCTPNLSLACSCGDGTNSEMFCRSDGTGFDACICGGGSGGAGSGGMSVGGGGGAGGESSGSSVLVYASAGDEQPYTAKFSGAELMVGGFFNGKVAFANNGQPIDVDSKGLHDLFLTAVDPQGNVTFATAMGSVGEDQIFDLAVAPDGDIVVVGNFEGDVDFGGTTLTSNGHLDAFVARYSAGGLLRFAKGIGGALFDYATAVAVAEDGNIFVAGLLTGAVVVDGTPLNPAGGSDGYIVKLTSNGTLVYATRFGDVGDEQPYDLAVAPNGHAVVVGQFNSSFSYGAGSLAHQGMGDVFMLEVDDTGQVIAGMSFGDAAPDNVFALDIAPDGTRLIAGFFEGSIDFGTGVQMSAGGNDAYVVSLAADGTPNYVRTFGDSGEQYAAALAVAADGRVYVGGGFAGALGAFGLASVGGTDGYVLSLDVSGQPVAASSFGGPGDDLVRAVAIRSNELAVVGTFQGTAVVAGHVVTGNDGLDGFIFRGALP